MSDQDIRAGLPRPPLPDLSSLPEPAICFGCGQPSRIVVACPVCDHHFCSENCERRHFRRRHLLGKVAVWSVSITAIGLFLAWFLYMSFRKTWWMWLELFER